MMVVYNVFGIVGSIVGVIYCGCGVFIDLWLFEVGGFGVN